jgi:hypothetical protein
MSEKIIKIRYVGYGDSIPAIPARDLTQAEIARLRPEEIEWMKYSNLYEFTYETPRPPRKPAAKELEK